MILAVGLALILFDGGQNIRWHGLGRVRELLTTLSLLQHLQQRRYSFSTSSLLNVFRMTNNIKISVSYSSLLSRDDHHLFNCAGDIEFVTTPLEAYGVVFGQCFYRAEYNII